MGLKDLIAASYHSSVELGGVDVAPSLRISVRSLDALDLRSKLNTSPARTTSLISNLPTMHKENLPHRNNRIRIRARYDYPLSLFSLGNVPLENEGHHRFLFDMLLGNQRSENLGGVRRVIETETCIGTKDLDADFDLRNQVC